MALPPRGGGEVDVALGGVVDDLDYGWMFNTNTRAVVGLWAANPTEDSFYVQLDVDGEPFRIDLPPVSSLQRLTLPATRRVAAVTVEKRTGPEEVVSYERLVIERVYTNPRRG